MGKFRELAEFELTFDTMSVGMLRSWKRYWTQHAEQLSPKACRREMKRVRAIEKAIAEKGGDESGELEMEITGLSQASSPAVLPTQKATARAGRIMYIENKAGGLVGSGRIGRVTFSKTGRTLHYRGKKFQSLKGAGFKSNYADVDTGEDYWISGPKRKGGDALYGGSIPIEIDEDVREEYWLTIRRQPERSHESVA